MSWALWLLGHPEQALEQSRQAIDLARRQEAKSLELRVAMSMGRLWQVIVSGFAAVLHELRLDAPWCGEFYCLCM
jgi:hypothetical protein